MLTWKSVVEVTTTDGFMLRMLSVPPSAIGFPSSPVTVADTAAWAAAGATAAAPMAPNASRAARPLLRLFNEMPPMVRCPTVNTASIHKFLEMQRSRPTGERIRALGLSEE